MPNNIFGQLLFEHCTRLLYNGLSALCISFCPEESLPIPDHSPNCCFCYLFPSDCKKMIFIFHLKIGCVFLFCVILGEYSLQALARISVFRSMCVQNSHESWWICSGRGRGGLCGSVQWANGLPSFCLLLCAQHTLQPESRHSVPQRPAWSLCCPILS